MNQCVGCQWRVPREMGGRGIICLPSENGDKCPDWATKWTKNWLLKGRNPTDEQIREANRL